MIWNDRQGRFSWLKASALAFAVIPGLVIAYWFFTGALMPLPVKNAVLGYTKGVDSSAEASTHADEKRVRPDSGLGRLRSARVGIVFPQ